MPQTRLCLIASATDAAASGRLPSAWTVEHIGQIDTYEGQREAVRQSFARAFATVTGSPVAVVFSDEYPTPQERTHG